MSASLVTLALWVAGLCAAAQFAKVGLVLPELSRVYPGAGATLGLLVSAISVVGALLGLLAGCFVVIGCYATALAVHASMARRRRRRPCARREWHMRIR